MADAILKEPRVALVTTTINVPSVLTLYGAHGPDVRFFVAGDEKTPELSVRRVMEQAGQPPENYYSSGDQKKRSYACSDLIGWNCIQRRNIAILEALKWGADIIVTIDDDNIPISSTYFDDFERVLWAPWSGLCIAGSRWFDPGLLLNSHARHRGLPWDADMTDARMEYAVDVRVGVAAGLCLGDPDVDAITRMVQRPVVGDVSAIGQAGVVVAPLTMSVFNSQNTAFVSELAPAMFLFPACGRYDDIFASLVTQAWMHRRDMHVHYGFPLVWQQRNTHDLMTDLKAELLGMEHVQAFANCVEASAKDITADTKLLDWLAILYDRLDTLDWWPKAASAAGRAWLRDCAGVMS